MTGGRFLRASEAIAVLGVLRDLPGQVAFDAVSIRTNTSGDARMSIGTRGRTYSATNAPLRRVIAEAFSLSFRPPRARARAGRVGTLRIADRHGHRRPWPAACDACANAHPVRGT